MPVPQVLVEYVVNGIESTTPILQSMLGNVSSTDPVWTQQVAGRFTLKEALAHWADWNTVFIERVQTTLREMNPILPSIDEGALSTERQYSQQDPIENLTRFSQSRASLVTELREVRSEDWSRPCHRELVGDLTLFQLVTMILGHDAYHLRQVADYLATRPTRPL